MKYRRHHNNKGRRQIQRGRTRDWAKKMNRRYAMSQSQWTIDA